MSINTLMNGTTKAVTASITLACNGTFTDCGDAMKFAWAGNPSLRKPAGLKLTIAAAAECAKGPSRPLMSRSVAAVPGDYIIRMDSADVSLARGLAAKGAPSRAPAPTRRAPPCAPATPPGPPLTSTHPPGHRSPKRRSRSQWLAFDLTARASMERYIHSSMLHLQRRLQLFR